MATVVTQNQPGTKESVIGSTRRRHRDAGAAATPRGAADRWRRGSGGGEVGRWSFRLLIISAAVVGGLYLLGHVWVLFLALLALLLTTVLRPADECCPAGCAP